MMRLDPDELLKLCELLLRLPNITSQTTRTGLLFALPNDLAVQLARPLEPASDLTTILTTTEQWGQLADGRWATDIVLQNAVRAARGTALAGELEHFRQKYEVAASGDKVTSQYEAVTGDVDWIMPSRFLHLGANRARTVARLRVPRFLDGQPDMAAGTHRAGVGTGWMIAPGLLITNEHVVNARFTDDATRRVSSDDQVSQAKATIAWFGYLDDEQPQYSEYHVESLEACDSELDFALLRLGVEDKRGDVPLATWGTAPLERLDFRPRRGDPLNIVQHPGGGPQRVTIRRNDFVKDLQKEGRFLYLTDTRPGSSGSPVFHDEWRVVGLHRAWRQAEAQGTVKGERIKYNNEGVWLSDILGKLPQHLRDEIAQHQRLR